MSNWDSEVKFDERTGLPELPEGYFWRIKKFNSDAASYELKIQIRQRRWIGSKQIDHTLSYANDLMLQGDAERLYVEVSEKIAHTGADKSRIKSYVGDYPPKALKEVRNADSV